MLAALGNIIKTKGLYILIAILLLIAIIKVIKKISAFRARKKELRQAAEDRARDENLNSYILNSHSTVDNREAFVPYEVDYSRAAQEASASNMGTRISGKLDGNAVMVQLIEHTGLSTRKFVLNASRGISIGTEEGNDITFISDDRQSYKCSIFCVQKKVFVRNEMLGTRILLRRKKQQAIVDEKGIGLKNGDCIVAGTVSYVITIVK